jgi:hypothetical protein
VSYYSCVLQLRAGQRRAILRIVLNLFFLLAFGTVRIERRVGRRLYLLRPFQLFTAGKQYNSSVSETRIK